MKKILLFTVSGALFAAPVNAVQKCVALNTTDTTCVSTTEIVYNVKSTVDWTATCTTNGTSVPITGVGVCSSTMMSSGMVLSSIETSRSDDADNGNMFNCWCKMTYPVVSQWVFARSGPEAGCTYQCASLCALYLQNNFNDVRSNMLSSLGS